MSGAPTLLGTAVANTLCIFTLLGLSIATFGYERALEPLYGVAATKYHLNKVVWVACIIGTTLPSPSLWNSLLVGGLSLAAMPKTVYYVAAYTARYGDPVWGPIATHAVVLGPLLVSGVALVKSLQSSTDSTGMGSAPMQAITLPVCRMAIMTLQDLWPIITSLAETSETTIFNTFAFAVFVIWGFSPYLPTIESLTTEPSDGSQNKKAPPKRIGSSASQKSYWRLAALPFLSFILHIGSPTLPKPLLEPYVHPEAPVRILSSVPSPYSGVVVVGEIPKPSEAVLKTMNQSELHSLRYLRAGHSLLGGVWIGDRTYKLDGSGPVNYDANGTPIGDSIYSAFIMQEIARLAQTSITGFPRNALMIGLGTGIAAQAFNQHGIPTSIVEVDPAVYEAATKYFGLQVPDPKKVYINDARGWVAKKIEENKSTSKDKEIFDVVIHDCFSGGGVPGHIFTLGFWQQLRQIVSDEGVVAVNFAGKMKTDSSRAILYTVQQVFPQCRAFHDTPGKLTDEKLHNEFINWIFLCTPTNKPLTLRPAEKSDFLMSYLRQNILRTYADREVKIERFFEDVEEKGFKRLILKDEKNPLPDWQETEALHHWKLMRTVLPDAHWETY